MIAWPAAVAALAVLSATVAWVRPGGWTSAARRDQLVGETGGRSSVARGCPEWFRSAAAQAVIPLPVERAWSAAVGAFALAVVLAAGMGGVGFAAVAAMLLAVGGWAGLRSLRHRHHQLVARSVPDSLDAIARSTRAGSSVVQALEALDRPDASPADRLLASVAAQVERGADLGSCLRSLVTVTPVPAVRLAATALIVASETGAPPARAVEGVAATLRDRLALDRELSAHSSQARASVAVLVLAPVGFGLFATATDPRVGQLLLRSPLGWLCLVLGLGLDALGAWWMRRIMADIR